jgi:hypothetical protein
MAPATNMNRSGTCLQISYQVHHSLGHLWLRVFCVPQRYVAASDSSSPPKREFQRSASTKTLLSCKCRDVDLFLSYGDVETHASVRGIQIWPLFEGHQLSQNGTAASAASDVSHKKLYE